MKIVNVETVQVAIPFEAPLRSAIGGRSHGVRTIIRMRLDSGVEAIGEAVGGTTVAGILSQAGEQILGESPFALERILSKLKTQAYYAGYMGFSAIGGLEMACWDAMGKVTDQPVYNLMGGRWAEKIDFAAYVYYRYHNADGSAGGESTPEDIVHTAEALVEKHGFSVLKLKAGVFPPEVEVAALAALRERFGAQATLRIDPQANWTYATALKWWPQLSQIGIEYYEDPVWGLDTMARLRREIPVPFATNMCVVDPDTLQMAVRQMPVDVILADPQRWGGLLACKKLAAVAETIGLGVGGHSGVELGVATAANLHLAASTPVMRFALDSHYHHLLDDIVTEPFAYADGCFAVPSGPGLGVTLDEAKLEHYAGVLKAQKSGAFHVQTRDPERPDFVPRPF